MASKKHEFCANEEQMARIGRFIAAAEGLRDARHKEELKTAASFDDVYKDQVACLRLCRELFFLVSKELVTKGDAAAKKGRDTALALNLVLEQMATDRGGAGYNERFVNDVFTPFFMQNTHRNNPDEAVMMNADTDNATPIIDFECNIADAFVISVACPLSCVVSNETQKALLVAMCSAFRRFGTRRGTTTADKRRLGIVEASNGLAAAHRAAKKHLAEATLAEVLSVYVDV